MDAVGIIPALLGARVVDADGAAAGVVEDLLADARTGRPAWVLVRLGDDLATAAVPCAALRSRTRCLQLPCPASVLASVAGRPPDPLLARRFGVPAWDLPRADALSSLRDGPVPARATAEAVVAAA